MLISILAAGSRGDTQPYLALGVALKKLGCRVRLAAFENYETFISAYGLEFSPIHGDIARVAASEGMNHARQADSPLKIFLSFNKLKNLVFGLQKDFFNACAGANAIVYHPGAAIGYFIAQHHKIPSILAAPFPMAPTRDYPALIFYDSARLGRTLNLATHKIFEKIMWSASSSAVKQFWKQQFGRVPENYASPFGKQNSRTHPTIISCSNYVFPRPADWPEHVHNTGYWFLDEDEHWDPPMELLNFLLQGKPPVYVGFGSLSDAAAAEKNTWLVIEALRQSGQRGVLATGWNGMARLEDAPEDIFILESAPHSWLFPRMAAVVHHGGAGTTAAGLRAGVPGVIIPHSNDQFAWGRRVYELGVGSKSIPRKNLTAERLSEAIDYVLATEIVAAAGDLGRKIRGESGAETAANIILNCLEQRSI